jgi:hypothetical protein
MDPNTDMPGSPSRFESIRLPNKNNVGPAISNPNNNGGEIQSPTGFLNGQGGNKLESFYSVDDKNSV